MISFGLRCTDWPLASLGRTRRALVWSAQLLARALAAGSAPGPLSVTGFQMSIAPVGSAAKVVCREAVASSAEAGPGSLLKLPAGASTFTEIEVSAISRLSF